MQDLKEPTQKNIDECVTLPGTHYFVVEQYRLAVTRGALYSAAKRDGAVELHTSYDKVKRVLRVVVTR